jgi:CHAD domain-containing protein
VAAVFDFEELSLDTASAKSGLAPRLCIRAEKRARKLFSQLAERLNVDLELTEARESALEEALALRGVSPRDPSALIREPLDPLGRADAAAKRVFGQLLGTLRCNEAGVIGEIDTEFLHDFRVAIRRTRAALRQLKSVFPDRQTERFVAFFAELGAMTSEPRDLDVFLLEFDGTAAELAEPLRRHLEPLRVLIQQRAEHAHRKLNRYLMSRNYRNGMASWQRFLAGPPPVRASARNARLAIKPLTDQRIWKLYRKLIRGGRAIGGGGDPAELHELRKTAKKLRYVMELFRSLYPSERVGPMLKALKDLQDYLGTYQDTEVKIAALTRFADELHGRGVPAPVLISIGALIDRAYVAERELRKDFHKRFSEFADAAEARKLKRMVKLPGIGAGDLEAQAA